MKKHASSNIHPFTNPSAAAHPFQDGQGAHSETSDSAAPGAGGVRAGGGAGRGRPTAYAPRVIDMLCDSIRRLGLSDSAAAEQQGMSTSTLSRWKQLHPEIGLKLKQARQEIRAFHLQRIMEHAAAENGKGWRASAWILERLFPGDYSPRMKERFAHMNLEDCLHDREAHEALNEQLRELHETQAEERAAKAAAQADQAAAEPENRASTSERNSQNSRNSGEAEVSGGPVVATGLRPVTTSASEEHSPLSGDGSEGDAQTDHRAVAPTGAGEEPGCFSSEDVSQNSRNSGGAGGSGGPVVATGLRPIPASASEEHSATSGDGSESDAQTAHRAVATTGVREELGSRSVASWHGWNRVAR